jgi:hypothetical protein
MVLYVLPKELYERIKFYVRGEIGAENTLRKGRLVGAK